MSTFVFGNGNARRIAFSNFALNGKYAINGGLAAVKNYSIGDLWGSQSIRFNGVLVGSDIKIIKTSDSTILYNNPSASGNDLAVIDWFYPPATNNIQIIITKAGYYFINTTLDLIYSASEIIFLIDQIEVAVGINVNDVATAVWDYPTSSMITVNSSGEKLAKKILTTNKFVALKE